MPRCGCVYTLCACTVSSGVTNGGGSCPRTQQARGAKLPQKYFVTSEPKSDCDKVWWMSQTVALLSPTSFTPLFYCRAVSFQTPCTQPQTSLLLRLSAGADSARYASAVSLVQSCPWLHFCDSSNPTHQLIDPTQLNPLKVEKFGPNPIQLTIEIMDAGV